MILDWEWHTGQREEGTKYRWSKLAKTGKSPTKTTPKKDTQLRCDLNSLNTFPYMARQIQRAIRIKSMVHQEPITWPNCPLDIKCQTQESPIQSGATRISKIIGTKGASKSRCTSRWYQVKERWLIKSTTLVMLGGQKIGCGEKKNGMPKEFNDQSREKWTYHLQYWSEFQGEEHRGLQASFATSKNCLT